MRNTFRPEFLNRIDETILFHPLTPGQIGDIVGIQLGELNGRLADKHLRLELTEEASDFIAERGFDPAYGARPLKRVIRRLVENPLAQSILAGEFVDGDLIRGDVDASASILVFRKIANLSPAEETVEAEAHS